MTPEEVTHFSHRLADLIVTAARTAPRGRLLPWRRNRDLVRQREQLCLLHHELVDTFAGAFALQSHDAAGGTDLLDALAPLHREGAGL